jgi:Zinc knuckle
MSINIPLRLPEFHGDPGKYPKESWKSYKFNLELAYKVAGAMRITDEQKAAHLLQGLQGKARTFLELNPELKDLPLKEVEKALDLQFGRSRAQGLPDLNSIVQKPSESVSEFAARMKLATMPMSEEKRSLQIMTEQEIKDKEIDRTVVQVWTPEEYTREQRIIKESADRFVLPYFIKGLMHELRRAVVARRPENLDDAIKIATEQERYDQIYGSSSSSSYRDADVNMVEAQVARKPKMRRDSEEVIKKVSEHLRNMNKDPAQTSASHRNRSAPESQPQPRVATSNVSLVCHYCGQTGHFVRQCPVKRYHDQQARQDHYLNGQRPNRAAPLQRRMRDMLAEGAGHSVQAAHGQPSKNASYVPKNGERPPQNGEKLRLPTPFTRNAQTQTQEGRKQG